MNILVILPTYNERENLEKISAAIFDELPEAHILVVDDGSGDGTGEIADRMSEENKRVHVIHRPRKMGLGTAYIRGFKYALENGYDAVFEMDADFSHDPAYLKNFIQAIDDCDLVLGSRYIEGGGVVNWGFIRKMVSMGGSLYSRIILGVPYRDLTGGFKCFRKEVLSKINLDDVMAEGYAFQIEMTYRAHKAGFRIREIPIFFSERRAGKSKMSWWIFIEAIYMVWKIKWIV